MLNELNQQQEKLEDVYEKEMLEKRISVLDILEIYPFCRLSFEQYLRIRHHWCRYIGTRSSWLVFLYVWKCEETQRIGESVFCKNYLRNEKVEAKKIFEKISSDRYSVE